MAVASLLAATVRGAFGRKLCSGGLTNLKYRVIIKKTFQKDRNPKDIGIGVNSARNRDCNEKISCFDEYGKNVHAPHVPALPC